MGIDESDYSHKIIVMKTQYLNDFPAHWVNRADVLAALGDVTRQRILLLFEPEEELSIKDIADLFPYSRTTITHHLTVLERAGILKRRKQGRDVFLRIDKTAMLDTLQSVLTYVKEEI